MKTDTKRIHPKDGQIYLNDGSGGGDDVVDGDGVDS
jgi:hypothetical protein